MDWQPLESKLLASSAYDAGKHILYLRFRSGEVYRYFEYPEEQHQEFLDAESHGRYFLRQALLTRSLLDKITQDSFNE